MTATSLLLALVVYPLIEEYLFRAILLQEADQRWPVWRGWHTNLAVSLLFGLTHLILWPPEHAAAVVLPSLVLGWIWQRSGRLWFCVLAHSGFNVVPMALEAYGSGASSIL